MPHFGQKRAVVQDVLSLPGDLRKAYLAIGVVLLPLYTALPAR